MSIGLKNVAIFGCVINLFHKGKSPPQDFGAVTGTPRPNHMSQDCGEIRLSGSLGITTERFPLDLWFLELALSLLQRATGKLGCGDYSGPLSSTSPPPTELPASSRHMFRSEDTSTSTWFLAERKVYLVTHLSLPTSINFSRVLFFLLETV